MGILLENLQIASPCPNDWKDMVGDDRVRFCPQCQKHVYNLSAMTTEEATSLLQERQGRPCIQLYRRWDGTVLTSDCRNALRGLIRNPLRWWIGSMMAILTLVLPGCSNRTLGTPAPAATNPDQEEHLKGAKDLPQEERNADKADM